MAAEGKWTNPCQIFYFLGVRKLVCNPFGFDKIKISNVKRGLAIRHRDLANLTAAKGLGYGPTKGVCFFCINCSTIGQCVCLSRTGLIHSFIEYVLQLSDYGHDLPEYQMANNNCSTLTSPDYSQNMYNTPPFPI